MGNARGYTAVPAHAYYEDDDDGDDDDNASSSSNFWVRGRLSLSGALIAVGLTFSILGATGYFGRQKGATTDAALIEAAKAVLAANREAGGGVTTLPNPNL